jgi:flagella basal body P-ring formation protein FlgA
MKALLLAGLAALALSGPALAGQPVLLKADTTDADGVVTLSDLFDGAGPAGRTPVARRTATSVVLNARTVQAIARRAGLDWANSEGLKTIVVSGGPVSPAMLAAMTDGPAPAPAPRGNVQVLTWARDISAGETIGPEDLVWSKAAMAPSDSPRDPDVVIGLMARRPLRAGGAARAHDVSPPAVIRAGEVITVLFQADGVSLALQGKALSAAGVGETLNVENPASKKIIQALVTGPGQAIVGPQADQMKAARSTRIAAR